MYTFLFIKKYVHFHFYFKICTLSYSFKNMYTFIFILKYAHFLIHLKICTLSFLFKNMYTIERIIQFFSHCLNIEHIFAKKQD